MSQENSNQQQQQQQVAQQTLKQQQQSNNIYQYSNNSTNNSSVLAKVTEEEPSSNLKLLQQQQIFLNQGSQATNQQQPAETTSTVNSPSSTQTGSFVKALSPNNTATQPILSVVTASSTSTIVSSTTIGNTASSVQVSRGSESGEEDEEVLEDSPDGRWTKRNESVSQRDVPGIDQAFLAMDTEYGIEVVWNEIVLSGGKKIRSEKDEIIFITEYMSSGSLKQFLRKAKRTNQPIKKQTWKRWCIQLLTALHYLHNCKPPIVHGNLTCDTIFIQHNGLIKIGSIAPDIVNTHVKTCIDKLWFSKNLHFLAPELLNVDSTPTTNTTTTTSTQNSSSSSSNNNNNNTVFSSSLTSAADNHSAQTAVDIYAFGMVALEMFNLELGGNGDTHAVTPELIKQSMEALDKNQRDFISRCLDANPMKRPNPKQLLFHPLLFEVPSLRLLAAHQIIKNQNESREANSEKIYDINDSDFSRSAEFVIATTNRTFNETGATTNPQTNKYSDFKFSNLPQFEANKYLEDVKNGLYPLTAFGLDHYIPYNSAQFEHQQQQNLTVQHLSSEKTTESASPSPSNTSLSGGNNNNNNNNNNTTTTNTSLANTSANLSSGTSSSATSPSQSLTSFQNQVAYHQQNNILVDSTHEDKLDAELPNYHPGFAQYQTSSANSSTAPTPTPLQQQQQQQQVIYNNNDLKNLINQSKPSFTSPSTSPPPISNTANPLAEQNNTFNAININPSIAAQLLNNNNVSRTQSPITTATLNNNNNNNNLGDCNTIVNSSMIYENSERRHAEKMEIFFDTGEKLNNNYKLTLTIIFDDKTLRTIESNINNSDTPNTLTNELISQGLVSKLDEKSLYNSLSNAFRQQLNYTIDADSLNSHNAIYLNK